MRKNVYPIDNRILVRYRSLLKLQEGFGDDIADKMIVEVLTETNNKARKVFSICLSLYFEDKIRPRWEEGRGTVWRDVKYEK